MTDQNPIFIPGPTNIPDRIRNAMNRQTVDHRSPGFSKLFLEVLEQAKQVFKTETGKVILFPSTGTGGWEAAVQNTLSRGDKVLAARHGVFSHRWIELCQRHGLDVEIIDCEWGKAAPVELMAERLKADRDKTIKAVLVTHNETATGVRSDIAGVRRALDGSEHPALLLVDGVSSIASMDFRMDEWRVDIAVCGSQKGFMLPAGMAILAVSEKALLAAASNEGPRGFFRFDDMLNAYKAGGFPYTPPLQHIYGLRESIDMLMSEGLENVFARHHRAAQAVREAARGWGFELCAMSPDSYSDTITAIRVPEGRNSDELTTLAWNRYQVSYGIGLGKLAGKVFRFGHLGSLTDTMVLGGLATIEMAMSELDYPITLGSGVAAAQRHFANHPLSA